MNDEDVLCFFLQPPSRCRYARGGKTIIDRSRIRMSSRRAIKTRDRFPAAIATVCSAWSTIFSITGGSSAVSHRDTIVPTASIGRSIRQTCVPTYAVYILATESSWWTYARLISRSSFESFLARTLFMDVFVSTYLLFIIRVVYATFDVALVKNSF